MKSKSKDELGKEALRKLPTKTLQNELARRIADLPKLETRESRCVFCWEEGDGEERQAVGFSSLGLEENGLFFHSTPLCLPCLEEKVTARPSSPKDILTIPFFEAGSYKLYWSGNRRHMAIVPEFAGTQARGIINDREEETIRRKVVH